MPHQSNKYPLGLRVTLFSDSMYDTTDSPAPQQVGRQAKYCKQIIMHMQSFDAKTMRPGIQASCSMM